MTEYLCVLYTQVRNGTLTHHGYCPDFNARATDKKTREAAMEALPIEMARQALSLQVDFKKPVPEPTATEESVQLNGASNVEFIRLAPHPISQMVLDLNRLHQQSGLSITEVARRMQTSRQAVHRILDPTYTGHSMDTIDRFLLAVAPDLEVKIVPSRPEYDLARYDDPEAPLATALFRTLHHPWVHSVTVTFMGEQPFRFEKAEPDPWWPEGQHVEYHTVEALLEGQYAHGPVPKDQPAWVEYVKLHERSLAYLERVANGDRNRMYGLILQHWYLPVMFPKGIRTSP